MNLTQNDYLTFLQYWKEICDKSETSIAERHLFKPSGVSALLPFVFLLEIKHPEVLEVRIAGTILDALSKNTLTGQNYLDVCPPDERMLYWQTLTKLHKGPYGAVIMRDVTFRDGQVHHMKSFNLPLVDNESGRHFNVGLLGIVDVDATKRRPEGGVAKSRVNDQYYVDLGHGLPDAE